jgi:hypothetical protein
MVDTVEDLDKELERLSDLVRDVRPGTHRWEIVWSRIDRILDERGKLVLEVFDGNNQSL